MQEQNNKKELSIVTLIFGAIGIFIVVFMLLSIIFKGCWYTVNEQSNAIVTQFGKPIKVSTAGFYGKIPFIQKVEIIDMTTKGTTIGYVMTDDGNYITDADNSVMITSDFNLLNIDFYMEYRVSDAKAFRYNSSNPENILTNIALADIRTVVSNYTVDEAMTTGKSQIQADIKEAIVKDLETRDIGLALVNITIQDSAPPTEEVIQAFKAVETAKQGADTAKNNALKYKNEQIPKAEAEADKITQSAKATKAARIAEAEGQVARFNEIYSEYEKYPLVTKQRLFYETMEELLPTIKVIITDGNTQTMLPLDSFTTN